MATVNLGRIKPVFRGAYDNSTAYVIDDIVTSGNETFIAIAATQGNATSDASKWTKLAAKGADGTDVAATLANKEIAFKTNAGALDGIPIGTAGQVLKVNSGATGYEFAADAGGKIGQVLQTVKTSTFSHTFGSSHSFVNITGLSQAITPVATSSKILLMVTVNALSDAGSQATIDTIRDTTQIFVGDAASNRISATAMANQNASDSDWSVSNIHYTFLDSPNTTSSITYQVRIGGFANGTQHVNKSERDSASGSYDNRLASSITLMEVLA